MRLPRIEFVISSALRIARRFPLVLAMGLGATAAASLLIGTSEAGTPGPLRLLVVSTLGMPLSVAFTLFAERRSSGQAARWIAALVVLAALGAVWWAWPQWGPEVQPLRYIQLSLIAHLLVAVLPYAGMRERTGFWHYNRILFLRFLVAALYAAVLFAGLAIALAALDKLFGIHVTPDDYGRLWAVIAFIFHPWFFLGGIPSDLSGLERRDDYPLGLQMFTQYVLVPIVGLYVIILGAYLAKVLITREWPSGWIGYLVSGVAAVGTLAWLLVEPLERRVEHRWVQTFARGFFVALLPAIVMLWLAIWKRVSQYGLTEPRYFLIVLSIWIAGIAVYCIASRERNIAVIPGSLCVVAMLTFAGPWGAYGVAERSQTSRLRDLLTRNELLVDGTLRPASQLVSRDDRREIFSILRFLTERRADTELARWLTSAQRDTIAALRANRPGTEGDAEARALLASLDLEYVAPGDTSLDEMVDYSAVSLPNPMPIDGYAFEVHLGYEIQRDSIEITSGTYAKLAADSSAITIVRGGELLLAIPFETALDSAIAARRRLTTPTPPVALQVDRAGSGADARVFVQSIIARRGAGGFRITSINGEMLVRVH
jgi:Domain of unknown function (DUF4153)